MSKRPKLDNSVTVIACEPCSPRVTRVPDGYFITNCEHCNVLMFNSHEMSRRSREYAEKAGKTIRTVCFPCAEPWFEEISRKGGNVQTNNQQRMAEAISDARRRLARRTQESN